MPEPPVTIARENHIATVSARAHSSMAVGSRSVLQVGDRQIAAVGIGCAEQLRDQLATAGIAYCDRLDRSLPPLPPALANQPDEAALAELMQRYTNLQIQHDPQHVRPAQLAQQLAKLYPDYDVHFLCAQRSEIDAIRGELRAAGCDYAAIHGQQVRVPDPLPRFVIGTYGTGGGALANTGWGLRRFQLWVGADRYFIPEARPDRFPGTRHLALVSTGARVPNERSAWLGEWFGPPRLRLLRPGLAPRQVTVQTVNITKPPPHCAAIGANPRDAAWQHPIRNRRIAQIARAQQSSGRRVAILCDGLDQAAELGASRGLRTWPIVATPDADCEGLPPGFSQRQQSLPFPPLAGPTGYLITFAALRADLPCDVIIRADTAPGLAESLELATHTRDMIAGEVRWIDVRDRWHPELRRRQASRNAAYAAAHWQSAAPDTELPA